VIDQESNNVSIQNVIEQITIPDKPKPGGMVAGAMDIISLWVRSDFDAPAVGRSRVVFAFPSGEHHEVSEFEVDLSQHRRGRTIAKLQGFPAREPGRYAFIVEFQGENETEWQQVAVVPIEVVFEPPEEGNGTSDETE
jgi:hypothetical protein